VRIQTQNLDDSDMAVMFLFLIDFENEKVFLETFYKEGNAKDWLEPGTKEGIHFVREERFKMNIKLRGLCYNVFVNGEPFAEYKYQAQVSLADTLHINGVLISTEPQINHKQQG
jgi:hypothetical protein